MEDKVNQIRLTSAELGQLWVQYLNDSASICMLTYFAEKAEDIEIKSIIEHAIKLSEVHIQKITTIFNEGDHTIPHGFKIEEDVDLTAPRLFSDTYVLNFIHNMAKIGLIAYSGSLAVAVREDITALYMECLMETKQLYKMSLDSLLSKGLYIRSPYFNKLEQNEFVKEQGFLWDMFGEKRPLIALEVSNLYSNLQRNALGAATLVGFSQVAQDKDVIQYFLRGIKIARKHVKAFGTKLEESYLTVPSTLVTEITDSTAKTFSDKIMMFYTAALIALSTGYYGTGLAQSPRVDLGIMYNKLSVEIQLYSEDGANIMIQNRWLEQPPMASDRDELAKKNNPKM
ncbi:DUF3231 family protein [Radiobacillus sp. PE A8.2]|uniref:DUF3231 family protein n=1 Tax=Radiobacillus sp. PE A8.2 TaxID=3380349 RepID=UPI003890E7C1